MFLSDAVKPIREKEMLICPPRECLREQVELLKGGTVDYPLFKNNPPPALKILKEVRAAVKLERTAVIGETKILLALGICKPRSVSSQARRLPGKNKHAS